jgi:hypothetical protein
MTEAQREQVEQLRAKVAQDPRTKKIAKNLGLDVNDYAGLVAHFQVTGEEPQFVVVPDQVLKKQGHRIPTLEQLKRFVSGEKRVVEASGRTSGFSETPRAQVALPNALPPATGPENAELQTELRGKLRRQIK